VRLQDLLFQSAGALVEDGQELFGQPFNLIQICIGVDISVPSFALSRDGDLVLGPLAGEVDADAGDDCGRVAQAHGGQVQRVGRHEVRGLSELFRCFDQLTALDHMGVRVVDGNIKAKGLEQDVLVAHQLLGLCQVLFRFGIQLGTISVQADIRHLDNMFQFTWLLLDLGGEEKSSCCDIIAVELCEAVEHVEPLHVYYRCVDA